jgi:hypothetical protein
VLDDAPAGNLGKISNAAELYHFVETYKAQKDGVIIEYRKEISLTQREQPTDDAKFHSVEQNVGIPPAVAQDMP